MENVDGQNKFVRHTVLEADDGGIQPAMTGMRLLCLTLESKIKYQSLRLTYTAGSSGLNTRTLAFY